MGKPRMLSHSNYETSSRLLRQCGTYHGWSMDGWNKQAKWNWPG